MLKETTETKAGKKNKSKEGETKELLFDIANFNFSLKEIDSSIKETKKLLMKHTGASGCTIMFLADYGYLWKIGERTTHPFKLGEGIVGWAAKNRESVFIKDIEKDKRYKYLGKKHTESIASIPVIKNDKVLGVINLTYDDRRKMNFPPQKAVLNVFAVKMQNILENILLYHESQGQRNELRSRKYINKILEGDLSLRRKLEEIKKKTTKFVDVENASIYMLDPEKRKDPLFKVTNKKLEREHSFVCDVIEIYTNKKGTKHDFLDLSSRFNFEPDTKKPKYITIYPIFLSDKAIGFILLEDNAKNAGNLSIFEKKFVRLISDKISKHISEYQSSKKMTAEKERWRTIFYNVDDGIILLSKDKKVIESNLKAREVLSYKKAKMAGKDLFSLFKIINPEVDWSVFASVKNINKFSKIDEMEFAKKIDNFFSSGKVIKPKEYYIETTNGKFWIILSMKTALKNQDEIYGIIHLKDITRRKEVDQDKNEFMSMVSHELRTPLSAMKGFLSMTLNNDYGKLNERQEKSLRRVQESNERMVTLVEDILDVSRIELGRFNLNKEPINLSDITCAMIRELSPKIKEKEIAIKVQHKNIDCCLQKHKSGVDHKCKDLHIYVLADRDRLMQIIGNLIDNAVKYSFNGGEIEIEITSEENYAELQIKDNGVGIAKTDQTKLFQRFSRIHNPLSIQAGGTGLGLYITKRLVKAHNGSIEVSSDKGKGSTFSVKIPIAKQLPLI